jgi:anti-sigma factor RsiW
MSEDRRPVGEDDLEAYIDGRLPPERAAMVSTYLASEPAAQARIEADRALRDELRARLAHAAGLPIPSRLRIATIQARRRAAWVGTMKRSAACVLLVMAGMGAGWEARDMAGAGMLAERFPQGNSTPEAADAIAAHRVFVVETAHPVEVGVAQRAHLVQWLSRRVGRPLKVPDLAAQGFELMGGRVLPSGDEAAAQFMYEDGAGHRLTLYVRASEAPDTAFRFVQAEGFSAFSWVDDGLGFAMVANIDRPRLQQIADATYQQLTSRAGVPAAGP